MSNARALTRNNLKIFYVNACSLRNKFSEIEEIAITGHYDLIGVTESWLNLEVRDYLAEYNIPGATLYLKKKVEYIEMEVEFYFTLNRA